MSHDCINEEPLVVLNVDQQAVAAREIDDARTALGLLRQCLQQPHRLSEQLVRVCLSSVELKIADLSTLMGVPIQSAVEVETRYADLRAANQRIHELEGQLGATQTPEMTKHAVRLLHDRLQKWWDQEGFGHISEVSFGPYGVDITFSCSLFGDFSLLGSNTPVSDKERRRLWLESLERKGFVLYQNSGNRDPHLTSCDQNRDALTRLFAERFPTGSIRSFSDQRRDKGMALNEVCLFVPDYEALQQLPVVETKEEAK